MNRTTAFLGVAAALLLTAVVVGLPKGSRPPVEPPPVPDQLPPPVAVVPPVPVPTPGSLTMTGKLSHPYVMQGTSELFATLEIAAVDVPGAKRSPVNLALVIDRSGSMSGEKIAQARRAALRLVDLLNEHDRLAIVHYGSDVRFFSGTFATDDAKTRMRRYIQGIVDEGGTNIGDGLMAGKRQLELARSDFSVNRLLLLSDGQPTVGVTSVRGLEHIASQLRSSGISVTALGVGADFNEDLMQQLADVGGGSYGFIKDAQSTVALFERDLEQAGTVVARSVTVQFEVPAGLDFQGVYGRQVSRAGNVVTVALPDFSSKQQEKLVVHFTAHVSAPAETAFDVSRFTLAYSDVLAERAAQSDVRLAALVTNDRSVADARRDKGAFVAATRAKAAANVERAAVEMQRGRFEEAKKLIQSNLGFLNDAREVAGAAATTELFEENERQFEAAQKAPQSPSPEAVPAAVKAMKVDSMHSYGRGSSVY